MIGVKTPNFAVGGKNRLTALPMHIFLNGNQYQNYLVQ